MSILSHEDILRLGEAVISAGLDRRVLLAGLSASFVAHLPSAAVPSAQILSDLDILNNAASLDDGTVPLQVWLQNAIALSPTRPEAAVFRAVLERTHGAGFAEEEIRLDRPDQDSTGIPISTWLGRLRRGPQQLAARLGSMAESAWS